ncbi:MAG TPA: tetratricopeptide repeat protein [Vicinamibacterales bacterium]|jgi:tetratricopeptide (TPR) repeat protein|nr:tetratricopeptide repeat protein [Vicinamibacterales bacterium]
MSAERQAAVRAAEKLLRVGKLPAAIEAYTQLVDEQPGDLDTALLLAQLHLRAHNVDSAAGRFASIADAWRLEGKLEPAFETYKKILAIRPADEHALGHAAALAITQGQTVEGRRYLLALADQQVARNDMAAAGDTLAEAATLDPSDTVLRERVFQMAVAAGNFTRAREHALTTSHRRRVSDALYAAGLRDDAIDLLHEALHHDPDHLPTVARLVRLLVETGDAIAASQHLSPGMAGADPEARVALVEILLRGGRSDESLEIARRTLADSPETVDALGRLAAAAAPHALDAALTLVDMVATQWTERLQWEPAATALQQFVTRVPGCIAALVRLVEVAVDGDLVSTASHAQEMLADAYLANGAVDEGLAIAEDLAAREPNNPVHAARVRQAQDMREGRATVPVGGNKNSTVLPFRSAAAS